MLVPQDLATLPASSPTHSIVSLSHTFHQGSDRALRAQELPMPPASRSSNKSLSQGLGIDVDT